MPPRWLAINAKTITPYNLGGSAYLPVILVYGPVWVVMLRKSGKLRICFFVSYVPDMLSFYYQLGMQLQKNMVLICHPAGAWNPIFCEMAEGLYWPCRYLPESNSAENRFDVIISTIYIKYLIQSYHLSIGYHICGIMYSFHIYRT